MTPSIKLKLEVQADEFKHNCPMPNNLSAYFDGGSPALSWSTPPAETKSIAILCEDPDAPREPSFVHWLVANLPAEATSIPALIPNEDRPDLLQGGIQGTNDKGIVGYYGPRPPAGTGVHHYHFHVLALDRPLDLAPGFDRAQFQEAIRDHVLAQGSVVGTYSAKDAGQES